MSDLPENQTPTTPEPLATVTQQVTAPEASFESQVSTGTPAPAAPAQAGFRDYFSKAGYDTSGFQDDASLVQATLTTLENYRKNEPYLQYGQLYQQHAADFQEWLANKNKPAAPAAPAQPEKPKWAAPEYDPSWEKFVEVDERTGRYKAPIPELAPYAQKLNAYADWQRQAGQKLVQNPIEALKDAGLIDLVRNEIQSHIGQALGARDQHTSVNEIIDRHSEWVHQHDAKGNLIWNPITQRPALTPAGEQYARTIMQLEQAGIADPRMQDQFATSILAGMFAQEQAQAPAPPSAPVAPPPTPAEQGRDRKGRFLDRARGTETPPNRNGAHNDNSRFTLDPDASFLELAMQEARNRGLIPATG